MRIGAHHGPVLYREGDYYGSTVNIAARVTSVAAAGDFVVTDAIRRDGSDNGFESIGAHAVKGIKDPIELHRVVATD